MRSYRFAAGTLAAFVALVFACSSSNSPGASSGGLPDGAPEGSVVIEDGAVVGPDGEVIPTPAEDAPPPKPPSKVNVTNESAAGRGYVLAVPKNYDAAKSYPLVVVFHGDGGDGATMRLYHPLDDVSGDAAIVAYPSGKNTLWDLYTPYAQNEDQQYVQAMVDDIKAKLSIDPTKQWAVGYSSGGFVINQLACRRAGLFTALVVHAGGAPYEPTDPNPGFPACAGGVANVIAWHGDADGTVDKSSGSYVAQFWASKNGCNGDPSARTATAPAPCVEHAGCGAGKRSLYCELPGFGHGVYGPALMEEWAFLLSL